MKKAIFILTLGFLLVAECTKAGVIITNPEFDSTEADYMILSKIELTDTATIVYADVYNLPNYWIYISSESKLKDSKGRTYKLLDCKDFGLDKEVYMPASGTMAFALYFEPVYKNEKIVDYIDLDEDKTTITGIKLYNVKHTEPVQCLLKGEVINRPQSNRLALLKAGEDFRTVKLTYIPIRDGKFEYTLYANTEEAYQLIFYDEIMRGSWRPIHFIAEQGTINCTLFGIKQVEKVIDGETWYSMEAEGENQITGGRYTNEYLTLKKWIAHELKALHDSIEVKQSLLQEEGKTYTLENINLDKQIKGLAEDDPKRQQLREQMWKLIDEGKHLTPEAKALEDEDRKIYQTGLYKEVQYAKEHTGIVGYTLLVENIRYAIWAIFGIGNAGGGEFLVGAEGNFLAVNPDIETIKKILQDLFDEKQTGKQ